MTAQILRKSKPSAFWSNGGDELWERYAEHPAVEILDEDGEVMLLPEGLALFFKRDARKIPGYNDEPVEFTVVTLTEEIEIRKRQHERRARERAEG